MRILIFSPHPDDVVIGCGGTLLKHFEKGDDIEIVIFSEAICKGKELEKIKKLGIKVGFLDYDFDNRFDIKLIFKIMNKIREFEPSIIITQLPEGHLDHIKSSIAVTRATELAMNKTIESNFKPHKTDKIYFFETVDALIGNTKTSCICFVDIHDFIKKKMDILKGFNSVIEHAPELTDMVESISRIRGFQSSSKHAEMFVCYPVLNSAEQLRSMIKNGDKEFIISDFEKNCLNLLK